MLLFPSLITPKQPNPRLAVARAPLEQRPGLYELQLVRQGAGTNESSRHLGAGVLHAFSPQNQPIALNGRGLLFGDIYLDPPKYLRKWDMTPKNQVSPFSEVRTGRLQVES